PGHPGHGHLSDEFAAIFHCEGVVPVLACGPVEPSHIGTEGAARHVSVRGGRLPRGEPGRVPAAQLLPRGVVAAPQRAQPHRSTTQLHQLSSTRHASWSPAATSVTRSGTTASALALDIAFNVGWWAGPNGRAW